MGFLKVKFIQKKALSTVSAPYFFDKSSKLEWTPNGDKLTTSAPGVKIASYDDMWYDQPVSVVEMTARSRTSRSSSTSSRTSATAAPSSTASSPSRSSRTRRR